ncbi:cyclin-dependent kinase inhibitor 1-like [Pleurodeles waltl]|uniref:cyclin-dependent kinase inhibitor 1-like n=1 Tax=Pleurodeles waltl TaxID=8319 RepID=UPI003709AA81
MARALLHLRRETLRIHQQGEQLNTSVNPEENRIQAYRVRRNLFGPVDHDLLQQDLQQFLRNSIELAGRKWNFDFVRDTPSVGMLEWEELGYHEVPAFYRSQILDGDETLHCTVAEQRPCCAGTVLRERNGGIDEEKQEGKKRQKEIKEYFSVKKQVISRNLSATKR